MTNLSLAQEERPSMFAVFARRRARDPTSDHAALLVPEGFEALCETLASGGDVGFACAEIGRRYGIDGTSLIEALEGLAETYRRVTGDEPSFTAVRALTVSWSDAALQYLHGLTCQDPLTGLASLTHLRLRLAEIYRAENACGRTAGTTHVLVVVELVVQGDTRNSAALIRLDRAMRLTDAAECLRLVYSAGETIGQASSRRAVAIVAKNERLGDSVAVLQRLVADWHRDRGRQVPRVWIEGLPSSEAAAARLLDELAR
jgi:hypothetical protein